MAEDKRTRASSAGQRALVKRAILHAVAATVVLVVTAALVEYDFVQLYPKVMISDLLRSYSARLEYTLRYQTLLVFWLLVNIFAVIRVRYINQAANPLDAKTEVEAVVAQNKVLSNSFESIVLSVFAQLIFVSFADSITVLKWIPYINIIQFIGRVAFLVGYPLKREFGFQLTVVPNIFLVLYNVYRLGSFVGLYA